MNTVPILPIPPMQYTREYMDQLLIVLRLYFELQATAQPVIATSLNFDIRTLPTEAKLADLRSGDVYRDTTQDNTLKVKV